jgi:hypothetical protein
MSILLPKPSKGIKFDYIFSIDMNDFDVEMLLPALFHLIRTRGAPIGKANDPELFSSYLDRLTQHDRLRGFSNKKHLLERWLRTSVVKMGFKGRAHSSEQISFLYPKTMLSYKAGWPKDITRIRSVHYFVYAGLLAKVSSPADLDMLFRQAFGSGLVLGDGPQFDGHYDGETDIDLEALLSICFTDQLTPAGVSFKTLAVKADPQLPLQASYMAEDILNLVDCYRGKISTAVLTRFLLTLINLHLFVYTLRLMAWVSRLADPASVSGEHEIFVDCTGMRGSYGSEIARACVDRDLEMLERYTRTGLRLRTLNRFVESANDLRTAAPPKDKQASDYLNYLLGLAEHVKIAAKAENEFESILHANGLADEESPEQESDATAFLRALRDEYTGTSIDRLVEVLYASQRKSAISNATRWYYSVAGFNRSYGLLSGNAAGGRRVSRYTMSNELLNALVHVALADFGQVIGGKREAATRLSLRTFLQWLRDRFGILLNVAPSADSSNEAVQAANVNFDSLKTRLKQIGVFQDLSDDFQAQYIRRKPSSATAEVNAS